MSLASSTSRPGPLCEWPLDRFLPTSSKFPSANTGRINRPQKRPLSPGGPSLFSPTKRRILNEEGIFSPSKTMKSPLRGKSTPSGSFGDLLRGPGSPAKKLEFESSPRPMAQGSFEASSSSASRRESTPSRAPSLTCGLASSPEMLPKTVARSTPRRPTFDEDDFFATPERLTLSAMSPPSFTLVPRELPSSSDPQSIHYSGFIVHQDAHVAVMTPPLEQEASLDDELDEKKENIAPRRKMKKAITEPADGKTVSLTPETKKRESERSFKAKSTPATPRKTASKERQEVTSPTPRRTTLRSMAGSPVVTEEERRHRRRMLKDEVEEAGGLDDDEDML